MESDDYHISHRRIFPEGITVILLMVMLFSACKNDIKQINRLTQMDTLPGDFAKGIVMRVSQNGKLTAMMTAPEMIREEHDSVSLSIFPQGFEMKFFDENESLESSIRADYGKDDRHQKVFEAKGNVIFRKKEQGQGLYTEHLIWNKKERKIYSFVPFKYVKDNSTIYGDTLIADEDMEYYIIKKSSADIYMQKNKL